MRYLVILLLAAQVFAQDFLRNLPEDKLVRVLTPQRFPHMDAVIILKEQSYVIQPNTIFYRGEEITGISTKYTTVVIVKLLNETAVKRYGNFENNYIEFYGDEIPNSFSLKARIMKPDGDILIMPEDQVLNIVSRESSSGTPLARKVICKIPNLAAGDVLQIEYTLLRNFTYSSSGIFFYNAEDFTLYSNLYITLPFKWEHQYFSLPAQHIGAPKIVTLSETYGSGDTYFWSLQNLNPIPDEPYSRPFADRSMMTAFIVKGFQPSLSDSGADEWLRITKDFYDEYLDEDEVSSDEMASIGLQTGSISRQPGLDFAHHVYTALRDSIELQSVNALRPLSDDIGSIFEQREGDASDLSYILYKILKQQGGDARIVLIRDRREGVFEKTIPTLEWFDRLGVLVCAGGEEAVFDFDHCAPHKYKLPWYLEGITLVVVNESGYSFKDMPPSVKAGKNLLFEDHRLHFATDLKLMDSIQFLYRGAPAEKMRYQLYDKQRSAVSDRIKAIATKSCLEKAELTGINDFRNQSEVRIDASGESASQADTIASRLVFNLKNHLLKEFRDRVYSSARRSDYFFEGPFSVMVKWVIDPPEGYTLAKDLKGKIFPRMDQVSARITYLQNGEQLVVTASVNISDPFMSYQMHPNLISLLDQVLAGAAEDIIFKKI